MDGRDPRSNENFRPRDFDLAHHSPQPTGNFQISTPSLSSDSTSSLCKQPVSIPRQVSDELLSKGLVVDDHGVVRWNEESRSHPRKWPLLRKAYDSAIICFLEFFMTLVSNMGSSIAQTAMSEFDISRTSALLCFTTMYLIGQAIGGLIFPPIAESFGGRTIYVTSTFGFALSCLVIAVWPNGPVIVAGRFLSGMLSGMPAVVAAGSIENMWDTRARIWVIHIWIAGAVIGLSMGPPVATYVSLSSLRWPFLFYLSAIVTAGVALLCLGMQESRPSQLLRQQVRVVTRKTSFDGLSIDQHNSIPDVKTFVKHSLTLPLKLFFSEPIVFLTSVMAATVYGVTYLFSEGLSIVYIEGYGFTQQDASSIFLALAVGVPFTFLPRMYDVGVTKKCDQNVETIEPEDKLFGFYLAAPILAIALWWFAWTVPPLIQGVSSWASISSLFLVGFSVVEFDCVLSGYLTDTYASYAGSANASMAVLRAVLSGVFPLFGPLLFRGLGANYTLFILASVATAYCGVAALFGIHGKEIRQRSPFAARALTSSSSTDWNAGMVEVTSCPEKCLTNSA